MTRFAFGAKVRQSLQSTDSFGCARILAKHRRERRHANAGCGFSEEMTACDVVHCFVIASSRFRRMLAMPYSGEFRWRDSRLRGDLPWLTEGLGILQDAA